MFALTFGAGFLRIWVHAITRVPQISNLLLVNVLNQLEWVLPLTLYLTIIFSMNYAKRHKTPSLAAFIIVVGLSAVFTWAGQKGLDNAKNMDVPPFIQKKHTLGKSGLILSRGQTVYTMLDDPALATGSRVVSIPGEPLIYQELPLDIDGNVLDAPPIPFRLQDLEHTSVLSDFTRSGKYLAARYDQGLYQFGSWVLALILVLTAFSFLFEIGDWHLANVFLGLLIFRGLLAFEVFFNSPGIQEYVYGFLRGAVGTWLVSPFVFTVIAVLILIYIILYFLALEKKSSL
ncbi:MAG: hypothetical protein Ta2G_18590 [Termitinemataceae bacterium]|nr:MAG: hypothetical protein Ta2G_18590 [Termitinemataceae bacterium]